MRRWWCVGQGCGAAEWMVKVWLSRPGLLGAVGSLTELLCSCGVLTHGEGPFRMESPDRVSGPGGRVVNYLLLQALCPCFRPPLGRPHTGPGRRSSGRITSREAGAVPSLLAGLCASGCSIGPHRPVDGVTACLWGGADPVPHAGRTLSAWGAGALGNGCTQDHVMCERTLFPGCLV